MPESPDFTNLVDLARNGSSDAQTELFQQFYPRVQRLVHKGLSSDLRVSRPWLSSLFSTRDVVQDVFLSVLRTLDEFRGKTADDFAGYLATLTRNRLIDAVRFHQAVIRDRRRVDNEALGECVPDEKQRPDLSAMSAEQVARFFRAIHTFNERDRVLLKERILNAEKFSDLAAKLGYASADSARKSFYTAQARLIVQLGKLSSDG